MRPGPARAACQGWEEKQAVRLPPGRNPSPDEAGSAQKPRRGGVRVEAPALKFQKEE